MITSEYIERLTKARWFANVGSEFKEESEYQIQRVFSWGEAVRHTENEITLWCRIEAGNMLSNHTRKENREQFQKWNETAKKNLSIVSEIIQSIEAPLVPEEYRELTEKYLRSILVGALLEESFSSAASPHILSSQIEIFLSGYFPCGMSVRDPESFPEELTIYVF